MALLHRRGRWGGRLFALSLAFAAGVLALAFLAERHARFGLLATQGNELRTIVGLKASEIAAWRAERLGDARQVAEDPFLAAAVTEWLAHGASPGSSASLLRRAASLKGAYGYERVALVGPEGRVLLMEPPSPVRPEEAREFLALPKTGILLVDLHRTATGEGLHLDLVVPLRPGASPDSSPVAFLVLKIDPNTTLYPLLKSWPVPSESGETLLVRREGSEVVYLSEVRDNAHVPPDLRMPLTRDDLASVLAVQGEEGPRESVDYRGARVLWAGLRVTDSPWFVVSKVDRAELLAPLARERWLIALLAVGLASLAALGVQLLWWREHRTLDDGLRESEERYRALAETSHDDIWIVDAEGRFTYLNARAAAKFSDRAASELLGRRFAELFPHDLAERMESHFRIVRDEGQPLYAEAEVEFPAHKAWIGVWLAPLKGRHFAGAVMGVGRDITERKKAEETIRVEERLLSYVITTIPDRVYFKDRRSRFVRVNAALARLFGLEDPREAVGKTDRDFFTEEHAAQALRDEQRLLATGEPLLGVEERETWPDGRVTWVSTSKVPMRDEAGTIVGVVGVSRDITERKKAEQELRESTRALLESQRVARLGSYRTDFAAGTWTSSEVLDDIFGIEDPSFAKDVRGWLSLVHPEERQEMSDYLSREILGRKHPFDHEYRILRMSDGAERWVHGLGKLVLDDEGNVTGMVGTIQDVTERKRAEVARLEAETQLRQSQKLEAIGQLAGGVAHDFNNLLAVITGYSEMVRRQLPKDGPLGGKVDQITKAAGRAAELTSQLLAFGRKQHLQPRFINLNDVVLDVEKILRRAIGENIELKTLLEPRLGTARADPGQIEQILINLAVNARDAMPGGGRLIIETRNVELDRGHATAHGLMKPGAYVLVEVADSGHGMSSETRARIFEPFFTTKEPGKGTGLGLSTVYGIVKQSGGYVWVYSELGLGTTFKVYLPRVDEESSRIRTETPGPAVGGSETVLLVEDETSLRELLRETLESGGYSLLVARDGSEALQLAEGRSGPIDLMVTDVVMPGLSGPQTAECLSVTRPFMRILFVSGYSDDAVLSKDLLGPRTGFLGKPFSPESLLRKVRELLDAPLRPSGPS